MYRVSIIIPKCNIDTSIVDMDGLISILYLYRNSKASIFVYELSITGE